jgi:hypothetical protein
MNSKLSKNLRRVTKELNGLSTECHSFMHV